MKKAYLVLNRLLSANSPFCIKWSLHTLNIAITGLLCYYIDFCLINFHVIIICLQILLTFLFCLSKLNHVRTPIYEVKFLFYFRYNVCPGCNVLYRSIHAVEQFLNDFRAKKLAVAKVCLPIIVNSLRCWNIR